MEEIYDTEIRNAELTDLDALLILEEKCWASHLRANHETITNRITNYPLGQYVVVASGVVCGVLYTQRIHNVSELVFGSYNVQHLLHDATGSVVQLMAIAIDTANIKNGAVLIRDHARKMAAEDPSIKSVVAMTRCSRFADLSPHGSHITCDATAALDSDACDAYVSFVHSLKDPTIYFHCSGGAQLQKVVPAYRPEDIDNLGHAVLIQYQLEGKPVHELNLEEVDSVQVCVHLKLLIIS
jgi:hypothetical protein